MRNGLEVRYLREHGSAPQIIVDADGVDGLIDALLASSPDCSMAQIFSLSRERPPLEFPDHEVFVGVDPENSVGLMAFADGSAGNVVTDSQSGTHGAVAYHFIGEYRVFPGGSEVSIDAIRRALREFLISGGLIPTCVTWQSVDDWVEWPEG